MSKQNGEFYEKSIFFPLYLILLFIASSCSYKYKAEIIHLSPVDSLGWQEDDSYMISNPSFISIMDGKLHIADESHEIKIYDADNMQFISKFGGKGSAPGEFLLPNSFADTGNGCVVSDMLNGRLQFFDKNYKFSNSVKQFAPFLLFGGPEIVHVCTHPLFPGASIYRFDNDSLTKVIDVGNLFEEEDIDDNRKKVYDVLLIDGDILLSFTEDSFFYRFHGDTRTKTNYQLEEGMNPDYVTHNAPHRIDDDLLVLVTNAVKPNEDNQILEYSLIRYNMAGEIEMIFRLPNRLFFPFCWGFDGENTFIYSLDNGVVYKFKVL